MNKMFKRFARIVIKKISNTRFAIYMLQRLTDGESNQRVIGGDIQHNNSFYYKFITSIARFNKSEREIFKVANFFFIRNFSMKLNINEYTQCGYFFGIVDCDLLSIISKGKGIFIDVGSNVGIYSLAASQTFDKVFAFEPSEVTFNLLNQNISLNESGNITIMRVRLSNETSMVNLYHNPLNNGGASLNEPSKNAINNHIDYNWNNVESVKTDKMDNVFGNINGDINLIKIDVEGHEISVIKGGLEIIKLHNPLIYAEVSGDYEKVVEIIDLLPPTYFAYSLVDNKDLSTVNYHIPSDVLFLPESKRSYLI